MLANERIKQIIDERHLSFNVAGKLCGLHKTTIKRIYDGESTQLSIETLQKIADGLSVPVENLLGWQTVKLAQDEEYLLRLYRNLSQKQQGKVDLFVEQLYSAHTPEYL